MNNIIKLDSQPSSKVVRCDKHLDQAAELYCKHHNTLVCYKCAFLEHSSHQSEISEFTSIADYANLVSIRLAEVIEQL